MTDQVEDKTSSAFPASKALAIAALGWFGYMAYLPWSWYANEWINAIIPLWNTAFAVGVALIVVQLFKHREWARRWLQSAALATAIMNGLTAVKPGMERYWLGVAILALLGWSLHVAREDYGSRDTGSQPGPLARKLGLFALAGTILIAVMPVSTFAP